MKGAAVSQYREAIEHLPSGGMLVVLGVTWGEYERLLEELADRPGVRVTFDQGRLQAVSPLRAHEHYARVMADVALIAAETLDLPFEQLGSTTLRHLGRQQGVEPDRCFYIANAGPVYPYSLPRFQGQRSSNCDPIRHAGRTYRTEFVLPGKQRCRVTVVPRICYESAHRNPKGTPVEAAARELCCGPD